MSLHSLYQSLQKRHPCSNAVSFIQLAFLQRGVRKVSESDDCESSTEVSSFCCLKTPDHFNTCVDDEFDFHGYVMRKAVVTSYIEFLHDVDSLYKNKFYKRAAIGAIRCAICLA